MKRAAWVALLSVAASAGASRSARLGFDGLGGIRIGMRAAALANAHRPDLDVEHAPCRYVILEGVTVGVRISRSRVVAVEVADPHHRTVSGIAVGSSVREVRRVYGRRGLVEQDEGRRFVLRSHDRTRALVLETDGRVVTRLIAGAPRFAEYVQGCL